MYIERVLKILGWLNQKARNNKTFLSKDVSWIESISIFLSKRFLQNLNKKIIKEDRIFCRDLFNLYEKEIWELVQPLSSVPSLQNSYLSLFKIFGKNKIYQAFLEDKVLSNVKEVQKYGTQIKAMPDCCHRLYPILGICEIGSLTSFDIRALNKRRESVGLDSIENYAVNLEKDYGVFLDFSIYK